MEGKLDGVYKLLTTKWGVEKPRLMVSVTGGAKNFDIEPEVLVNFKETLKVRPPLYIWPMLSFFILV